MTYLINIQPSALRKAKDLFREGPLSGSSALGRHLSDDPGSKFIVGSPSQTCGVQIRLTYKALPLKACQLLTYTKSHSLT